MTTYEVAATLGDLHITETVHTATIDDINPTDWPQPALAPITTPNRTSLYLIADNKIIDLTTANLGDTEPTKPPPPIKPPPGAGDYTINPGTGIIAPDGQPFRYAGLNAAINAGLKYAYVFEGCPVDNNATTIDAWADRDNTLHGRTYYPGGVITSQNRWSEQFGQRFDLPDRLYAINGTLTDQARQFGITPPVDHWQQGIIRATCQTRARSNDPNPDTTHPGYVASINELLDGGLVVMPELHNQTAANLPIPETLRRNPTASPTGDQRLVDAIEWQDTLIEQFNNNPNVWITLPNEPWTTCTTPDEYGAYFEWVKLFVRRARAQGARNLISIPPHPLGTRPRRAR